MSVKLVAAGQKDRVGHQERQQRNHFDDRGQNSNSSNSATEAGVRWTYDLPVGSFQPVSMFLDPVPSASPLDPSTISRVSVYILDKQEGPFQLVISAIDTSS